MNFKPIIFLIAATVMASCQDNVEQITIPLQAKVCVTVKHHALTIPDAEVFIKLNGGDTLQWDGSKYDRKLVADANAKGCFEALPVGNHWLMAYGYDTNSRLDVIGRLPIKITKIDQHLDVVLLVSER
jgi:hypothetical protein